MDNIQNGYRLVSGISAILNYYNLSCYCECKYHCNPYCQANKTHLTFPGQFSLIQSLICNEFSSTVFQHYVALWATFVSSKSILSNIKLYIKCTCFEILSRRVRS